MAAASSIFSMRLQLEVVELALLSEALLARNLDRSKQRKRGS